MEEPEPWYFAGGKVHGAVAVENNTVPQNVSSELPTDSAIPLPELKAETQTDMCTPMLTAALLTITKRRGQPRSPETDTMDKRNTGSTHSGTLCSLLKGNRNTCYDMSEL